MVECERLKKVLLLNRDCGEAPASTSHPRTSNRLVERHWLIRKAPSMQAQSFKRYVIVEDNARANLRKCSPAAILVTGQLILFGEDFDAGFFHQLFHVSRLLALEFLFDEDVF